MTMTEAHSRSAVLEKAKADLQVMVEGMCRRRGIPDNAAAEARIECAVKAASDQLYLRERGEAFNADMATDFPAIAAEHDAAIRPYLSPGHKKEKIAQLWKVDRAADRRTGAMFKRGDESGDESDSKPTKGAGEKYDPDVVMALAQVIGALYGRNDGIAWTRLVNRPDNADLDVLVAAYYLASVIAWSSASPWAACPVPPKPNGLVKILRRADG